MYNDVRITLVLDDVLFILYPNDFKYVSAKLRNKVLFVCLLVVNSFGPPTLANMLETLTIIYIACSKLLNICFWYDKWARMFSLAKLLRRRVSLLKLDALRNSAKILILLFGSLGGLEVKLGSGKWARICFLHCS